MRVLITGGAGFIGSHLVDRLLLDGHSVSVLDNVSTGQKSNLDRHNKNQNFAFINGSVLDQDLLAKCVNGVDYIFHLAAAVGVFTIVNHPLSSLVTNIRGTENVLEIASKFNTPVFLSSSSEVYARTLQENFIVRNGRSLTKYLKKVF